MKNIETELLGFDVTVTGVCETLPELIAASTSEDVVVNDCNRQVLAHSHYSVLRTSVIIPTLEKLTGILRLTAKNKNLASKDDDNETEGKYVARLVEELGLETVNSYEAAISAACAAVPVDYKPGTRGSGDGGKPAAKWLAYWDAAKKNNELDRRLAQFDIDTTLPEEEQKVAFAKAVKKKVTDRMRAAEAAALDA